MGIPPLPPLLSPDQVAQVEVATAGIELGSDQFSHVAEPTGEVTSSLSQTQQIGVGVTTALEQVEVTGCPGVSRWYVEQLEVVLGLGWLQVVDSEPVVTVHSDQLLP